MKIFNSITELVGNTPILKLNNYKKAHNLKCGILAKLEYLNPAGSVKDRVALSMIEDAKKKGLINKDTTIIEPTSGNTGIGLAFVAASKGYKIILTLPDTMSMERRDLLEAYGAELILTDGKLGMDGSIKKAEELIRQIPNSFMPSQFENLINPKTHMLTTGVEIWDDTKGEVDVFVAGIGTGGTISGVGEYLKSKNNKIEIVGVEPLSSPILSKGQKGPHKIQGIGAGFIPKTLNTQIYDKIITVKDEDAYSTTKEIARIEGFLVGISSGAALFAAKELAKKEEYRNKNIVVLFPDSGDRYLSTKVFK